MRWRLGVVGLPVAHSLSPRLHVAGLALAQLEGESTILELREDQAQELRGLMGGRFDALSVTMPLKGLARALADEVDEVAERVGAVNSLLYRDGRLLGANTDGPGLLDALEAELSFTPSGRRVVLLGAGGAARGIADALVRGGAHVRVRARRPRAARELAELVPGVRTRDDGGPVDLVVNTTPAVGRPDPELERGAGPATFAVDITYEPRRTPWRALYDGAGCATANGLGMLAYQAARQMSWWWDRPVDGARLREVIA